MYHCAHLHPHTGPSPYFSYVAGSGWPCPFTSRSHSLSHSYSPSRSMKPGRSRSQSTEDSNPVSPRNSLHRQFPRTKQDPVPVSNEDEATATSGSRWTHFVEVDVYAGGASGRGENLDNPLLRGGAKVDSMSYFVLLTRWQPWPH